MSEMDVIVVHIRAEQAGEYERLFAERELPRWRAYKERGAFLSARLFRAAFGTDERQDVAKYVIAVEVPSHVQHSEHDADPGFQEFNRVADALQPEDPLVYGGEVLHSCNGVSRSGGRAQRPGWVTRGGRSCAIMADERSDPGDIA